MSADIIIHKLDEVTIKIQCEQYITKELSEQFTFDVPGAKFMPSFRSRHWDGKVRLLNSRTNTTYAGLYSLIEKFANDREYDCEIPDELLYGDEISLTEADEFIKGLNLPVVAFAAKSVVALFVTLVAL